ncbi:hypothetical protein GGI03_001995 [Coemansia sp. RSA 2337]|nr:hypothetical protein GGI08_003314 [Coemansia sp. S2]KAJ2466636.1 hypothetical protein GGI03_001995 [Coemansia sp. RSA 2337]
MENPAHNDRNVPDSPAPAKLEPTQSADTEELDEFDVNFEVQSGLLGSLARLVGNPGAISMAGIQAAVLLLQRELPASYDYVAVTTSSVSPVAATSSVASSVAAPAATLSVTRPTAAEKGKAQALPDDGPKSAPLRKHQAIGPPVEIIEISSDEEDNGPSASKKASSSMKGDLPNADSSSKIRGYDMLFSLCELGECDSVDQRDSASKIHDQLGNKVTYQRILFVFGPFLCCHFDLFIVIYRHMFGCKLVPLGVDPREFMLMLADMEGFRHWSPEAANMDFICCTGHEFRYLTLDIPQHLGLMGESKTMVLAPRLCYFLATMCGLQVDRLTGAILDELFAVITGESLQSLLIVTGKGIRQMTNSQICDMVKTWVESLCLSIAEDGGMAQSFDMALDCNGAYGNKGGSIADSDGLIALQTLKTNKFDDRLLLRVYPTELQEYYPFLSFIASRNTSTGTKEFLGVLSRKLLEWPK